MTSIIASELGTTHSPPMKKRSVLRTGAVGVVVEVMVSPRGSSSLSVAK
jgi:hypothetical protein